MIYSRLLVILLLPVAVAGAVFYEFRAFLAMARVAARDEINDARRAWKQGFRP